MTVRLPNGTEVSGTKEELGELGYLPPPPKYIWDGSPVVTAAVVSEGVCSNRSFGWPMDDEVAACT